MKLPTPAEQAQSAYEERRKEVRTRETFWHRELDTVVET